MLIMFCPRENFSQRICYIQVRVYFTNLYISILDMLADGVKPALNMLGILVRPWFLGVGYGSIVVTIDHHWVQRTGGTTPSSVMNPFIQTASCAASEAATYSASVVDPATTGCLELLQLTAAPFKRNTYPD